MDHELLIAEINKWMNCTLKRIEETGGIKNTENKFLLGQHDAYMNVLDMIEINIKEYNKE